MAQKRYKCETKDGEWLLRGMIMHKNLVRFRWFYTLKVAIPPVFIFLGEPAFVQAL